MRSSIESRLSSAHRITSSKTNRRPIGELKHISAALTDDGGKTISKDARDFTLEETIHTFGLDYSTFVSFATREMQTWKIAELPQTKGFPMTPCFGETLLPSCVSIINAFLTVASLVENYSKNFDRASGVVCSTGIHIILNECLTALLGSTNPYQRNCIQLCASQKDNSLTGPGDGGSTTPTTWDNVKVYGEMSFSHKIIPQKTSSEIASSATTVTGRIDHCVGRALSSSRSTNKRSRRGFEALLLVVEAGGNRNVDDALPQLLTFMACIHQSRVQRRRSDASVFGVSSDGYKFIFVTIGHDESVKLSRRSDITQGSDLLDVWGCLKYTLETSASLW